MEATSNYMSRDVTPTAIAVRVVALCLMVLCARRSDAELAFSANRGQAQEIYSIDERVGEPSVRNLTNHFANDYMPDWSPDGRQIAFTSDRDDSPGDIFVMDSDGASQRNLTRHPARDLDPSWAPDGKHIAFASWRNVRPDIFVVDIDGGGLRALTEHPHIDWEPSWSPDGRWIAFTSWKAGADIHLISPDGDVITRLTDPSRGGQPSLLVVGWPLYRVHVKAGRAAEDLRHGVGRYPAPALGRRARLGLGPDVEP